MSGLNEQAISEVMNEVSLAGIESEEGLLNQIRNSLCSFENSINHNFETLTKYEKLRGESSNLPAIVVTLEGASATGKSLIALELMYDITATRFISTDSVRQIIRGVVNQEMYPELFCHTYQAHTHRQVGPTDLNPVVRGFLAQCEIITPHLVAMAERVIAEGAIAVLEGVHLEPGVLQGLSPGVIEILINPDTETHRAMFASKHAVGKLKTISENMSVRKNEFEGTRAIQEYMIKIAKTSNIPIVPLTGYDEARREIASIILSKIEKLLNSFEDGAVA